MEASRRGWPLAWAAVAIVAIVAAVGVYVFHSARSLPGEAVAQGRAVLRDLARVAQAFEQGTITTSFTSYATEVTGSSYLQFARLQQTEIFERKDQKSLFWGQLPLPDVVVEARAPVEYTYYLDLNRPWKLTTDGSTLLVHSPPIEWNTPAVDVSALRFEVREGSVWRDEVQASDALKASLTQLCRERARQNVPLIRETGRRQTEDFVRRWLVTRFSDGRDYRVLVFFPDETPKVAPPG